MNPQQNQKKGSWSTHEDQKLIDQVSRNGIQSWTQISKDAGLLRSGKSCRLRWMNYLRPDLKQECFTIEEIKIILHYHQLLGNKWSMIASHLPGRTDNEIKNFYHTYVRKRIKSDNVTISRPTKKDLNKNKQKTKLIMSSTSPGLDECDFPILESYVGKEGYSDYVLDNGSVPSSSIGLSETNLDGEGHEEGWMAKIIFAEPFPIEDEIMLGMNSISFCYEFSSWEYIQFPETSSYAYNTLLSSQDFD